jgi:uncharacterized protein YdaU (DUF1376 family)
MHFFSVFPDAWMTGTAELTTEESGAFWNLCCYYVAKDGVVRDDDVLPGRIVKLGTRRWKRVKARLLTGTFIEVREGFIWQETCEKRLKLDGKFASSQKDKAQKRWAQNKPKPLSALDSDDAGANPGACASSASASSSVAKATGGSPPTDDPDLPPKTTDPLKALWDFGISILTEAGSSEKAAREMLGKWRSVLGDDPKLMGLLVAAKKQRAFAPIPYIQKIIENERRPRAGYN